MEGYDVYIGPYGHSVTPRLYYGEVVAHDADEAKQAVEEMLSSDRYAGWCPDEVEVSLVEENWHPYEVEVSPEEESWFEAPEAWVNGCDGDDYDNL